MRAAAGSISQRAGECSRSDRLGCCILHQAAQLFGEKHSENDTLFIDHRLFLHRPCLCFSQHFLSRALSIIFFICLFFVSFCMIFQIFIPKWAKSLAMKYLFSLALSKSSKSTSAAEAPTISFIHKYMNILNIHTFHCSGELISNRLVTITRCQLSPGHMSLTAPTSLQFHKGYTEFSFFEPPLSLDKLAIIPLLFALGAAASEPCAPSMPIAISSMRRRVASSCKRFSSNEQIRKIEIKQTHTFNSLLVTQTPNTSPLDASTWTHAHTTRSPAAYSAVTDSSNADNQAAKKLNARDTMHDHAGPRHMAHLRALPLLSASACLKAPPASAPDAQHPLT
jgi:hypothetical protein